MRFLLFLLSPLLACAGVHLINDSPYTLRAVIQGYDGTYLGEMILQPQHLGDWSDSYGTMGRYGPGTAQSNTTRIPYTVLWYCLESTEGDEYSICTGVATGSTVTAQSCQGRRMCKPKKKPDGNNPQQSEGLLNDENGFSSQEKGSMLPGQ